MLKSLVCNQLMYLIIFFSGGGQYCLSCAIDQEKILSYYSKKKMLIKYPRGEIDHMYCCFRLKCLVFQPIMAQSKHELGIYMTYEMIRWQ